MERADNITSFYAPLARLLVLLSANLTMMKFLALPSRFASICFFAMVISLFVLTEPAYAGTIRVPDDQPTIQGAINAAADGDIITVKAGTYPGALTIAKPITLRADGSGASNYVIDATGSTTAITINTGSSSPGTVTIQGFTIRNNTPVPSAPAVVPAGGIIATAANLNLIGNDFSGSTGDTGLRLSISTALHITQNNFSTDVVGAPGHCATMHTQLIILGSGNSTYISVDRNTFTGGGTNCQNSGITLLTGTYSISANRFKKVKSPIDQVDGVSGIFVGNVVEGATGQVYFRVDPSTDPVQDSVGPPAVIIANNSFEQVANPLDNVSPYMLRGSLAKFAVTNNVFVADSGRSVVECLDDGNPAKTPITWFHNLFFNKNTGIIFTGVCNPPTAGEEGNLFRDPLYVGTGTNPLSPSAASPLIDAGTNSPQALAAGGDIVNNPRLASVTETHAVMDIGAYEYLGLNEATYSWLLLTASKYIAPIGSTVNLNAQFKTAASGAVTVEQDGVGTVATQFTNTSPTVFVSKPLHAGVNIFHANFIGDGYNFPTSTPPVYVYGADATRNATATSLTIAPTPAFAQQVITFSAHVSPATATGTVDFLNGSNKIGTAILDGVGSATMPASSFPIGTYSISAVYSGDANFEPSTSPVTSLIVNGYPTTLAISTPAAAFAYETKTALIHVSSPAAPVQPSAGTVTLSNSAGILGTGPLDANGNVSINFSLPAGNYSLTATYAANGIYLAGTGTSAVVQVIADTTATTLTADPMTQYERSNVRFTATVTAAHSTTVPAGFITLFDGANSLRSLSVDRAGHAVFDINVLPAGTHTLTSVYTPAGADTLNFLGSTSNAVTVLINPSDFTLTAPPTLSVKTQHHTDITISSESIGNFVGTVRVSCNNLPPHAQCYFNHGSSILLSPGGKGSLKVYFETSDVLGYQSAIQKMDSKKLSLALFVLPLSLLALRRKRIVHLLVLVLFAVLFSVNLCGCNGMYPASTPPGTYTVQFIGTGNGVTHTASTTLTVTQ